MSYRLISDAPEGKEGAVTGEHLVDPELPTAVVSTIARGIALTFIPVV